MSILSPVSHVIFDCDGLLLDSEKSYEKMYGEIAKKYGKTHSWDIQMKLMGTTEWMSARTMIDELDLPITPGEFIEMQRNLGKEMLPEVSLMPGVEKLLMHLKKHNIPFAMITSSSLESVDLKSSKYKELFALFHHIVSETSDVEVKRSKPFPDIYLVCASRFPSKPAARDCLVFEDAPSGVVAGRAAGMQVVMVPDPRVSDDERAKATLVISSLEEFQPQLFGLPPFEN